MILSFLLFFGLIVANKLAISSASLPCKLNLMRYFWDIYLVFYNVILFFKYFLPAAWKRWDKAVCIFCMIPKQDTFFFFRLCK